MQTKTAGSILYQNDIVDFVTFKPIEPHLALQYVKDQVHEDQEFHAHALYIDQNFKGLIAWETTNDIHPEIKSKYRVDRAIKILEIVAENEFMYRALLSLFTKFVFGMDSSVDCMFFKYPNKNIENTPSFYSVKTYTDTGVPVMFRMKIRLGNLPYERKLSS